LFNRLAASAEATACVGREADHEQTGRRRAEEFVGLVFLIGPPGFVPLRLEERQGRQKPPQEEILRATDRIAEGV
jgi:hypothetical protein